MSSEQSNKGVGVDSTGGPVIDPTRNVLDLVEAANKRQDDLREAYDRLHSVQSLHVKDIAEIRALHSREIAQAEKERLKDIRQVDVDAVKTEATRALTAIETLARVTTANAESAQARLTNTAATIATENARAFSEVTIRLAALERSSYEGKGKEAVIDPQLTRLIEEVRALRESYSKVSGKSEGIQASWALLIGIVSLIVMGLTILGAIVTLVIFLNRTAPAPIYTPAPTGTTLPTNPPNNVPR